jgi:hypothetical protein
MAVRYVIVPKRVGPRAHSRVVLQPSRDVAGALAEQVDFRQLDATDDFSIFENAAWVPLRATLTQEQAGTVAAAGRGFRAAGDNELAGAAPALADRRSDFNYGGGLKDDSAVLFAETASPRWHLHVGKHGGGSRVNAYGFGTLYRVPGGGKATLRYSTSILRWLSLLLEAAVWIVAIRAAWNWRRSTRGEVV